MGERILGLGDTIFGGDRARVAVEVYRSAKDDMRPYLGALLRARRTEPRDDLMTRLVQAEVEGERLSEDEIFSFFQLLLLAGTETTTNLIANAVSSLLDHPDQLSQLRTNLDLLPAAIEEVLRFRSPVQLVFRQTTDEVTLRGKHIPARALVLAVVGSANRDSRHYQHADRFDINRQPAAHVGFGHGIHFCVGAALGRLESRVALSALLQRTSDIQRSDGDSWKPRAGFNVHGPERLRLRVRGKTG